MMEICIGAGIIFAIIGGVVVYGGWQEREKGERKWIGIGIVVILVGILIFGSAFMTPTGKLWFKKQWAGTDSGNWLVIDNSGGKTMRHWILKKSIVQSSSQSDGWEFFDDEGNLCYISGDAFVMRINQDFDAFMAYYKQVYNIPIEQDALK